MKKWTGERLETFVYSRDTIDHLHRYVIALNFVRNKIVLDIASGEGYGTNLLAKKAKFAYGVDISEVSINKAKLKYSQQNLQFLVGSTSRIPIDSSSVDVVISFETIEHHEQHKEMMLEIKRVLRPNGILIISTPDKLYYSDRRNFENNFHVKELYKREFVELLFKYFKNLQLLTQQFVNGNSIILDDKNKNRISLYTGEYLKIEQKEFEPLYMIAIVSDDVFKNQNDSIFDGNEITNKGLEMQNSIIYNSKSYKLGHFILKPFKYLKKKLNR
ncbi:MAG: class I SAM-dependent methyltransferase [Lutibacter sp.]|uniref:class I SAM-dependent methyltransferase n=1 Tax=Lutibacter sp. TaxID=1925666 RepID=UPI00299E79E7|nr:class I SAM-dependent methyltransferase [Lutibacter sp.]MDX1828189.1 class I SAM-dependent methyltransferase [Lutibacter sp.]